MRVAEGCPLGRKRIDVRRCCLRMSAQGADPIVQVVDGQSGLTAADREVAAILRQAKKSVIIAANKLESAKLWDTAYEFYELGLGEVFPVSALHGSGTGDLLDAIVAAIPLSEAEEEEDDSLKITIMGRPNSGKSTLLNIIGGLDTPSSGNVYFYGKDLTSCSDHELTSQYRRLLAASLN